MKFKLSSNINFINCMVGWVFLITGGVFYYESNMGKSLIQFATFSYVLIVILKEMPSIRLTYYHILYFFLGLFILTLCLMDSFLVEYGVKKIDSIIFNVLFSAIFFKIIIDRIGVDTFFKNIIIIGFILLIPTVIYKYYFGFFQRDVNFLFNGANVFGWLSGAYSLLCLMYFRVNFFRILFFIFLLCVFWSESKGSLIALLASISLLTLYKSKFNGKSIVSVVAFIFTLFCFNYIVKEYFSDSRIGAIFRFLEGSTGESDYGSVGIRLDMYNAALELFYSSFLFGVGLGDFSKYTSFDIMYPHNVFLELLAETGVIGLFFFVIFYIIFLIKNKNVFFSILVFYFLVVCFFSGDLSYLRFSMFFVLLALFFEKQKLVKVF